MSKDKSGVSAEERGMAPISIAFLLGVIAGAGVYGVLLDKGIVGERSVKQETNSSVNKQAVGKETTKTPEVKAPLTILVAEDDVSLVIVDQPADTRVVVSMIILKRSGWIAVHDLNADDSFGKILGARHFEEGQSFAQTVALLRATEEGKRYALVLHADDGDAKFDHTTEVPAKDKKGKFVFEAFTANGSSER